MSFTHYGSIDDALGAAETRYFGHGYKRVTRRISALTVAPATQAGRVHALADLSYPDDWSQTMGDALVPHLSSIDAVVISTQLAKAYLAYTYGLVNGQRGQVWTRRIDTRAGVAPHEDLTTMPVRAVHRDVRADPEGRGVHLSRFECRVGTMNVTTEIAHAALGAADFWETQLNSVGHTNARDYDDSVKDRDHSITDVDIDLANMCVSGLVRVSDPEPCDDRTGLGAHHRLALPMIEAIAGLAQLAQALTYAVDGLSRDTAGTFWLRRLSLQAKTPCQPMTDAFVASLRAPRTTRVCVGARTWRLADVEGDYQGIRMQGSVAFELPPAQDARARECEAELVSNGSAH